MATLDGLPILDAEQPVIIHVTKRDIKKQGIKDPAHCAIAETARRELGCKEVRVHLSRIYLKMTDHWLRFETSEAARTEIVSFDRSGRFQEGEYLLRPLRPSARTGVRQGAGKNNRQGGQSRNSAHILTDIRESARGRLDYTREPAKK